MSANVTDPAADPRVEPLSHPDDDQPNDDTAPAEPTGDVKMIDVTVIGNYQVRDDGVNYGPGESALVPESVAQEWIRDGYVEAKS